jgi:hypothetical protein
MGSSQTNITSSGAKGVLRDCVAGPELKYKPNQGRPPCSRDGGGGVSGRARVRWPVNREFLPFRPRI